MLGIQVRIAREPAIVKICNADSGDFEHKTRVYNLIRVSFTQAQY